MLDAVRKLADHRPNRWATLLEVILVSASFFFLSSFQFWLIHSLTQTHNTHLQKLQKLFQDPGPSAPAAAGNIDEVASLIERFCLGPNEQHGLVCVVLRVLMQRLDPADPLVKALNDHRSRVRDAGRHAIERNQQQQQQQQQHVRPEREVEIDELLGRDKHFDWLLPMMSLSAVNGDLAQLVVNFVMRQCRMEDPAAIKVCFFFGVCVLCCVVLFRIGCVCVFYVMCIMLCYVVSILILFLLCKQSLQRLMTRHVSVLGNIRCAAERPVFDHSEVHNDQLLAAFERAVETQPPCADAPFELELSLPQLCEDDLAGDLPPLRLGDMDAAVDNFMADRALSELLLQSACGSDFVNLLRTLRKDIMERAKKRNQRQDSSGSGNDDDAVSASVSPSSSSLSGSESDMTSEHSKRKKSSSSRTNRKSNLKTKKVTGKKLHHS